MATNSNEAIPYHKRIAMGEKLDGQSMQAKGQQGNKGGGLAQTKKK